MRRIIDLNNDWKFIRGDFAPRNHAEGWGGAKGKSLYFGMTAADLDDSSWQSVCLPHDYGIESDYSTRAEKFIGADRVPDMQTINSRLFSAGSLPGDVAWYRKRFTIPYAADCKRAYLKFDGVYRSSTVYLNEHFVGTFESGYTGFDYDVSDYIYADRDNVLCVRTDSTAHEGWWYEGGGIYRGVHLVLTNDIAIAESGICIASQPDLGTMQSDDKSHYAAADLSIQVRLTNRRDNSENVRIDFAVCDDSGSVISDFSQKAEVPVWDEANVHICTTLKGMRLWSPQDPYLYTMTARVYGQDDALLDEVSQEFGVRSICADADRGLFINGQPYRIQGVCLHENHAGLGIALTKSVMEYRVERLKSIGVNAIRCAHNPPDPYLLTICDREGILVMDETRKTSSAPEYIDQLRRLILRDRNHPCIYCWSIGNEEVNLQFEPEAKRIMHTMKMEVRKLDKTRPITMALVFWDPKGHRTNGDIPAEEMVPLADELDIAGFNYWQQYWDPMHKLLPNKPLMNTEATSGGWTRSCYSTDTASGHYYAFDEHNGDKKIRRGSNLVQHPYAESWQVYCTHPYLNGYFVWTGFDYRGEPTPMPYPAIASQFGLMDGCGFKKDIAYYFKSVWKSAPVLHIFPHWNLQGREGERITVYAYSNMDEIELFVNGKSYGRQRADCGEIRAWHNVEYQPGCAEAVGYKRGIEQCRTIVKTTGSAQHVALKPWRDEITLYDSGIIDISLRDENDLLVPTAENKLYFDVQGEGIILGAGNGDPGSHESDKLPLHRAFHGLCQLHIKPLSVGSICITVTAEGIGSAQCRITVTED